MGPDSSNYRKWCWVCDRVEHDNEDTYLICFECNHVYQTGEDLSRLDREMWRQSGEEGTERLRHPRDIHSCPLCAHDFVWHPEWQVPDAQ